MSKNLFMKKKIPSDSTDEIDFKSRHWIKGYPKSKILIKEFVVGEEDVDAKVFANKSFRLLNAIF